MPTDWIIPTPSDVATVMSSVVIGTVENTGNPADSDDAFEQKILNIISMVVARVRGAVSNGNRTPLSATLTSVPADGWQHTVNLAVQALVASTPNMGWTLKDDFETLLTEAKLWLNSIKDGDPTDYPTDPILTTTSGYPVGVGNGGGDIVGEVDMTTDSLNTLPPIVPSLPIGNTAYSGSVDPNGVQTGNNNDQYFQYDATGQLLNVWIKTGVSGTNVGWQNTIQS